MIPLHRRASEYKVIQDLCPEQSQSSLHFMLPCKPYQIFSNYQQLSLMEQATWEVKAGRQQGPGQPEEQSKATNRLG